MATRHHQAVVSQQQRGDAVHAGKQKAVAGADGRNRQALGDIGNLVNLRGPDGKPVYEINRPVTRSFGAQLLANAQKAAAAATNKKPVAVDVAAAKDGVDNVNAAAINKKPVAVAKDGVKAVKQEPTMKPSKPVAVDNVNAAATNKKPVAVAKDGVKAVKQKPTMKPSKPEAVITISPDTEEETKHAAPKNPHRKLSMKKVQTLTSVLSARSKVACGVVDKPKDQKVQGIDALDADDQLAVVDYVEDIYKFYKHSESSYRPYNYMESQLEINAKMRAILADWLIEVHQKFELMPETLYLTFYVMDRYLSMAGVLRKELQLVGVSSMLIASKYEEIWAPEIDDFICISDMAYTREEILAMEKEILNKLEWNLTVPTPYVFLVRFLKASQCDEEMENMVFFFAELAMLHYSMIKYCPSMLAASAVYAARCTLKKSPLWSEALKCHTGLSEPELLECTKMLVNFHSLSAESKLKVVHNKYSSSELSAVALQLPVIKMFEGLKLSE